MILNLANCDVDQIVKLGKALANPYRITILKLCEKSSYSITDIQKKIGVAYLHIHNHVNILQDAGLVETNNEITRKGKVVLVKALYSLTKENTLKKI
jgi:predicted transcriptional regulator